MADGRQPNASRPREPRRSGAAAPTLDEIAAAARSALPEGTSAWLVGGCLRDELLGRAVVDADFAVDGAVEPFARALADRLGGSVFSSSDRFGTWRIVLAGRHVDIAALRAPTLEADLRARDFTVDALARPLDGREVVDPLNGVDDLAAGRLRLCSPQALKDDPLRILRLARLARGLGMVPDAAATEAAFAAAPGLAAVSGERLRDELSTILAQPREAALAVRDLAVWGALSHVLPELEALRGHEQNPYHHLDVFEHSLEALTYVSGVVSQLGGAECLTPPEQAGLPGVDAIVPVSWAVLLHDIGKPRSRIDTDDGRVLFWKHDEIGREMVAVIAERLRLSTRFRDYLGTLVRCHLRLGFLVREQPLTRRALARYRRDVDPWVFESVVVSLCDRLATRGEKTSLTSLARHYRLARTVWGSVPKEPVPRLLSGEDVMDLLDLEPGPAVGEALEALDEEVAAGEVTSPDEARAFLSGWRAGRESGLEAADEACGGRDAGAERGAGAGDGGGAAGGTAGGTA